MVTEKRILRGFLVIWVCFREHIIGTVPYFVLTEYCLEFETDVSFQHVSIRARHLPHRRQKASACPRAPTKFSWVWVTGRGKHRSTSAPDRSTSVEESSSVTGGCSPPLTVFPGWNQTFGTRDRLCCVYQWIPVTLVGVQTSSAVFAGIGII